jgi:hypothetical protein
MVGSLLLLSFFGDPHPVASSMTVINANAVTWFRLREYFI